MDKQKLLEQREKLSSDLSEIVDAFLKIEKELQDLPHPNGTLYRSLKPKSGMYVVHVSVDCPGASPGSIMAVYEKDNQPYEIHIRKTPRVQYSSSQAQD